VSAATAAEPVGTGEVEAPAAVPVETLSYTEASRELDTIVSFFDQREVDVDVLVARLERATALIDELDKRLRQTRAQVEELVPRLETLAHEAAAGADTDE
jgi:exodeoxyribonuclease VII small subunit